MPAYAYQTVMCCTTSTPFDNSADAQNEIDAQMAIWVNNGLTDGLRGEGPFRPSYTDSGMRFPIIRKWTTIQAAQDYVDFVNGLCASKGLDPYDEVEIMSISRWPADGLKFSWDDLETPGQ